MAGRKGGGDKPKVWRPPGWEPVGGTKAEEHAKAQQRAGIPDDIYQRGVEVQELRRLERSAELDAVTTPPPPPRRAVINPRLMTDGELLELVKDLARVDRYDWRKNARPEQLEPDAYSIWLVLAGRGFGKTRAGAETAREKVKKPNKRVAVIAKASRELRDVCFEGKSGLLNVIPPDEIKDYRKGLGDTYIDLKNGSKIIGFTAESPDSIRGHAFDWVWGDEFAAWPKHLAQDMLDQAMFTMRESDPRIMLTTTPKRLPHVVELMNRYKAGEEGIVLTTGSTRDNKALSKAALAMYARQYAGTRLGAQELEGVLLEDVEGALWTLETIAACQLPDDRDLPTRFDKVIIGVDPSGSATGDATGIVALGIDKVKKCIYVLGCASRKGLPAERYTAVCMAAVRWRANEILVEYNFGGDNAIFGIEQQWKELKKSGRIDMKIPLIGKSTLRGDKAVKAGPVAALYEQQMNLDVERIWHARSDVNNKIATLEGELSGWAPKDKWSPNSMDALVIGARRAMLELGWEASLATPGAGRRIDDGGWRP